MVGVAQLAELRIVVPAVVGSSPIAHPSFERDRVKAERRGLLQCPGGVGRTRN